MLNLIVMAAAVALTGANANAHPMGPADCGDMEVWDYTTAMCLPRAMPNMPMKMLMVHGNSFFTQTIEEKPRGTNAFSVPDMIMADIGSSLGDHQYINLDVMGTFEKWTFPKNGTPELLQIGEDKDNRKPFLDAQHPHSSPIMGLTLSDTVSLGAGKDHLKFWFAPRGQSTDGPVAFMHRATGLVNPDAPLGHHIGQDVGHITSTVIGASARLGKFNLEISGFNGSEPQPTDIDLPIATPNSYAVRATYQFTPHLYAMASLAYAKHPEPNEADLDHVWRYSSSVYADFKIGKGWMLHDTFIWGLINNYDHAAALNSFTEEAWLHKDAHSIWGRLEVLQRTPDELDVATLDPTEGRWVTALTLGYTHRLAMIGTAELGLGGSVTKDFLPTTYQAASGGNPLSAKIFLQLGGMGMWDL